ncbi:MAG: hypothetical protein M1515_04140 [Candidatus Thermoplasmatota archaeon]|jgi:hypothetical protein|nr:hypothetical protein [Candidatus Thermoplasmatota archaeon]
MKSLRRDTLDLVIPLYAVVTVFIFIKTAQIVGLPYIYSAAAIVVGLIALVSIPFSTSFRTFFSKKW